MGWYKKSGAAQLTETVKKWLMQAYQGSPDLGLVDQDISQFPPSPEDEQAVEMGANMAKSQLKLTELTTIQQGVLDHIRSRFQGRAQQPQPPQVGDATPQGANDFGMGDLGNAGDAGVSQEGI